MNSFKLICLILIALLFSTCNEAQKNETLIVKFGPAFTFGSDFQVTKDKNGAFMSCLIFDSYIKRIQGSNRDTILPDTISLNKTELTNKEYKLLKDSVIKRLVNFKEPQDKSGIDGMLISYFYQNQENSKKLQVWSPHEDDPKNDGYYLTYNFIQVLRSTLKDSLHQDYLNYLESYINDEKKYRKFGPVHRLILERNKTRKI